MARRLIALGFAFALTMTLSATALAAKPGSTGFNQYGYNYNARIFNGLADGVDRTLDGMVWGDPTYAKDHLVMKWNAAWDACNANGYDDATYCLGALDTNEWNGMVPGGSGETDHVKIIWVGSESKYGATYWVEGGTRIWGNYEIVLEQGFYGSGHEFLTKSVRPGLGA
jgi:hypothetical protein